MHPRIEDYALIGDHQTAALVNRHGSIDWLCLPRFDSAACFAALLGDQENGHWTIAPRGGGTCARRAYRHDSLVLDTEWETDEGTVRVTDLMPQRDRSPDVVRIVEGLSGRVTMRSTVRLRFDYGSAVPWMRRSDGHRVAVAGPDSVWLRSEPGVRSWSEDRATYAEFTVGPGEKVAFVLTWHPSHEPRPRLVDPYESLETSLHDWRAWAARCRYTGPHRDTVVRSLITLKALTYAPTGGIVAAATTSLPEEIGGVRNWDYRHCWLRDSTLTLGALLSCGYQEEAEAWRDWLLRAAAGDPADLQIMYGLAGERRIPEYDLPWLSGYEDSRPVRVGNDAVRQLQLDVYGEVMDSVFVSRRAGLPDKPDMWRMQCALMEYLRSAWRKPDEGLWEVRGPRRHFTHSKVMCWVAADRAVRTLEDDPTLTGGDLEGWRALRDEIHREVCDRAYDPERGTFTQSYGSRELDASLLLIPLMGFLPPDDPRVVGTVDAIRAELSHEGLVRRYGLDHRTAATTSVDGLPGGEGTFLVCSFWLADALHLTGRTAEARELFERLVGLVNDVGLLAEEYDPVAGRQLGNFPQAFSHVGLVGTALALFDGKEAG
ncbi:glycoside hydrolase family 15 protein [Streptomyces stelliscabiei]|uniref:Trehalase n=2 Tax=Streptomyces stelliscabiei TaxID=146820 RepID=A0A8I0NYF3_9ACTN|nr:glycoside hydrolase family 15 protein [Streptomyces stelliscabiei]KND44893.1 glucoamylase [Streptomyces stelliscabiei]MBE1596096.1 GH15 family glucan-1,4-alpha-glucosidase [Streptomyces stelliscabiei]MDX2519763.1 glycoside hydrolase family 15 protein [Streptomyces stelliscabiei]MDX2556622.1 glycoside hydrolase family 15 protein [Streptomyces stelliscabiei]MDX2615625.1 glycoside hydrolase family 15 protein [Streptomyces stelliscabiei]